MRKLRLAALAALSFALLSLHAQELPRKAGEWSIQMPDGKQLLLSAYHGKVVVLAFILTTCPHCQKTVGILGKIQTDYAARGVQVLASALEANAKAAVPGFVQNFHPTFPVGYNDDANTLLSFAQYTRERIPLMPIVLLIDRQGMVRAQHDGHDEQFFGDQQDQNFRAALDGMLKGTKK
jgi:thiol-disulfide isomerase/thioredoxin